MCVQCNARVHCGMYCSNYWTAAMFKVNNIVRQQEFLLTTLSTVSTVLYLSNTAALPPCSLQDKH